MQPSITIRAFERADLPSVRPILDRTNLFPSAMLAEMAEPYLSGHAPHHWLVVCRAGQVAGFAYAEPERMTDGTFNLLAIAVDPELQRCGLGAAIVSALAAALRDAGGRVLLVETSSADEYAGTRAFYARLAFDEEARIRSFYSDDEDKVVFWKRL